MSIYRRISVIIPLMVAFLAAGALACAGERVQGRVRSIARDARVLSLQVEGERSMLVNWDKGTAWKNLKSAADISVNDVLAIDYRAKGDQVTAGSVTLLAPVVPAGIRGVGIAELAGQMEKGGALPFRLIDVRPVESFDAGHLAGAVSVPLRRIEKGYAGALPDDKGAPMVFCDNGAGDDTAARGAELSVKLGYTNVAIFADGAWGWERSGRFLASSPSFLRKGKAIIIDLRPPEKVAGGHIERAVSIPAERLAASQKIFPLVKRLPIIVYGERDAEAIAAAATIRAWGYPRVTYYPGGVAAWVEAAEVLTMEEADEFINVSERGIRADDFKMALISTSVVRIVDLRGDAEHSRGNFPEAAHIPLEQLSARHGELDKESILVLFASDTEQAEMAADFLNQKGYRVNYLQGRVEFKGDGKYLIK